MNIIIVTRVTIGKPCIVKGLNPDVQGFPK